MRGVDIFWTIGVQGGTLYPGVNKVPSTGYLGLHSQLSTGSGTTTDRSIEVQNKTPTNTQLTDQGNLLFHTSRAPLERESNVDWDAGGIILLRGSLKARCHVVVGRASSDSQDSKHSPQPELLLANKK